MTEFNVKKMIHSLRQRAEICTCQLWLKENCWLKVNCNNRAPIVSEMEICHQRSKWLGEQASWIFVSFQFTFSLLFTFNHNWLVHDSASRPKVVYYYKYLYYNFQQIQNSKKKISILENPESLQLVHFWHFFNLKKTTVN